jgi:hypothetical protein
MDDVTTMISQVLSDPAAMRQLQSVAASLGLGGTAPAAEAAPEMESTQPAAEQAPQGPDLSALSGLLGGLMGARSPHSKPLRPRRTGLPHWPHCSGRGIQARHRTPSPACRLTSAR